MMSPASVTHITDFDHNCLINLSSSLVVQLVVLSFHFFKSLTIFVNIFFLNFIFFFHFILFIVTFLVCAYHVDLDLTYLLVSYVGYIIVTSLALVQVNG